MNSLVVAVLALLAVGAVAPPAPFEDHCLVGEAQLYNPANLTAVPEFELNLDLPPEERWKPIAKLYAAKINV